MQGVDYASVDENQPPNISVARQAGVKFAIVRGAFSSGGRVVVDQHMTRDRGAWGGDVHATGRITPGAFGAYLILGHRQGDPSPVEQVHAFIRAYGKRRLGELPPTLDVEFPGTEGRKSTGMTAAQALQRCEVAYETMRDVYGVVMTYTSTRVWKEDLDDIDSAMFSESPLWIKTGYVYKAGNKPHPESCPATPGELPKPWQKPDSADVWLHQYQGDSKGYPGFSSTVDCNKFLVRDCTKQAVEPGSWIAQRLATYNFADVVTFQRALGLTADGIIGPATFAMLSA